MATLKLPGGYQVTVSKESVALGRRVNRQASVDPALGRSLESSESGRLLWGWLTDPITPHQIITDDLRPTRARSREQSYNNPYVRRFHGLMQSNVLGDRGIVLQARARYASDGRLDRPANSAIEDRFADWGETCDYEGELEWYDMTRLAFEASLRDGEAFLRRYRGNAGGEYGYKLQHIDAELVPVTMNMDIRNGRRVRNGIEFDSSNRRTAYYIGAMAGTSHETYSYGGINLARVPADDIIHVYDKLFVGQHRGFPWISSALVRLKMLHQFDKAALVNARAGAMKLGVAIGPSGQPFMGTKTSSGENVVDLPMGSYLQFESGTEWKTHDPTYPHSDYEPFTKACLRGAAAGLLMSYPIWANDLEGVNYSSIRAGTLEDRRIYRMVQRWFSSKLHKRAYRDWLRMALILGKISVPGGTLNDEREAKYRRVVFVGPRWEWVDPDKELKAIRAAIELKLRSRTEITLETTGREFEDVLEEIEEEERLARERGISLVIDPKEEVAVSVSQDQ